MPGLARRQAEEQLLGRSFVLEGQRVRVVSEAPAPEQPLSTRASELRGRCGTVVRRAVLVAADDRDSFSSSVDDSSDELRAHCVHVDGVGLVTLQPHEVEPWPRVGQRVDYLDERAKIVAAYGAAEDPSVLGTGTLQWQATPTTHPGLVEARVGPYLLLRLVYARGDQLKLLVGERREPRVGDWVVLRATHVDGEDPLPRWDDEDGTPEPRAFFQRVAGLPLTRASVLALHEQHANLANMYVVKAVCAECGDCFELEHTSKDWHPNFTLFDDVCGTCWGPQEHTSAPPARITHLDRCEHMGADSFGVLSESESESEAGGSDADVEGIVV